MHTVHVATMAEADLGNFIWGDCDIIARKARGIFGDHAHFSEAIPTLTTCSHHRFNKSQHIWTRDLGVSTTLSIL